MTSRSLVLITGAGRSGTSTMSGSLHHLGLSVPGPFLGADDSNPKGFFESRWSVRFHKALLREAGVDEFDNRPDALDIVAALATAEQRQKIVAFLADKGGDAPQVVVKDPRTVWTQLLWKEAAAEVGRDIRYISMLRHPAEVIGSRATYYASDDAVQRHRYEIFSIARWVNSNLICERQTRADRRAFVSYLDLLADWRPVMRHVGSSLDLDFDPPITPEPHPVDDFIDAGLRRHKVTWDELDIPAELQRIAQDVWDCLQLLVPGEDPRASARLDQLSDDYRRLLADASAISHDIIAQARRDARAALTRELGAGAAPAASTTPAPVGRLVDETSARDLIRIVGGRVVRRVGRRR